MKIESQSEALRSLVHEYRRAHRNAAVDMANVALWALQNKRWHNRPIDEVKALANRLSKAMREEMFVDPQGRKVRSNHAYKGRRVFDAATGEYRQEVLWTDLDGDPRNIRAAFQLRRVQIFGDCRQLKTDADSFNDNQGAEKGVDIQMDFNFTRDLAESDQPDTYEGLEDGESGDDGESEESPD